MSTIGRDLTNCGFKINHAFFDFLSEDAKIKVTDSAMTEMFKFITDKYNSIDFSEIEKSGGDYTKFKYRDVVKKNIDILREIYTGDESDGAKAMLDVLADIDKVQEFLYQYKAKISYLYKSGDGITQVLYTSLVAGIVYSVSGLVSDTIRFISLEKDEDLYVVFEETNNVAKNIHIKNIQSAAASLKDIQFYIDKAYENKAKAKRTNESVELAILGIGLLILAIPKIIPLIRQIIYSIYYVRVSLAQAIEIQVELININIESLEATGRAKKKVIVRQKRIVAGLTKLMNMLAVRTDDTGSLVSRQIAEENKELKIDRNSPLSADSSSELLL